MTPPDEPRHFYLVRDVNDEGISGGGRVAEGFTFATGITVLVWVRAPFAIGIYPSMQEMKDVHGHGGRTRISPAPL